MHPSHESSPSPDNEFNSYQTAWDAAVAPARNKARRQYGKTNSQKKDSRKNHRDKGTFRRYDSEPLEADEPSFPPALMRSSSSSISTEITVNRPAVPVPLPSRSGFHQRSMSFSSGYIPRNTQATMQRHNSLSILTKSVPLCRSSSSSLNSDFELEHENLDPNIIAQDMFAASEFDSPATKPLKIRPPLSTMDEHPKARPRKIRALSDIADLQRSFSDLARDADAAAGWDDATPKNTMSLAFDFGDLEASSPHGSVATMSSRKRGVCDSIGAEDILSDVGSHGGSRRRSKSRSRIYSADFAPMLESVRSLNNTTSTIQPKKIQRQHQTAIDSDDGGDNASDDGMESVDPVDPDKSFESDDWGNKELGPTSVTNPPRRLRRSSSDNFEEFVFGAATAIGPKILTNGSIVKSMPSEEDLKFLIKNLRKSKKSAATTFGKMTTWTVSLPNQWTSERRTRVLHWSTQELGFSMRAGGPSIVFLNIASSKAPTLLSQLENAFLFHRDQQPVLEKSKPSGSLPSKILEPASPERSRTRTIQPSGFREPRGFDVQDESLIQAVNNLNISASNPSPEEPSTNETAKLFRTVTLDPHHDCVAVAQPRHSGEHIMGGTDLVSHMHAASPRRSRARLSSSSCPSTGRPPRLLIEIDHRPVVVSSPFVGRGAKATNIQHSAECLETPHMTRRSCWEHTKNGRDWGVSIRCTDDVLRELNDRFEDDLARHGQMVDIMSSSVFATGQISPSHCIDRSMDEVDEESTASNEEENENHDLFDDSELHIEAPPKVWNRRSSVGAAAFADLNLNEVNSWTNHEKLSRRRLESMAKHKRVSLCSNPLQARKSLRPVRSSYFSIAPPRLSTIESTLTLTDNNRFSFLPMIQGAVAEEVLESQDECMSNSKTLLCVFSFLNEQELLCRVSPVCTLWADVATEAHAVLMLSSVGCTESSDDLDDEFEDSTGGDSTIMLSMEQPWKYLVNQYPHACFLAGGAFKNVYKVYNISTQAYEALSVMDIELIESTGNKHVVGAELAVSAMVSSLVRRNICPNFVVTRRVFTCPYEPPKALWGSDENKRPRGAHFSPSHCQGRKPREPSSKHRSKYQYMRMELCSEGDAEEYLKKLPDELMSSSESRLLIFQVAFALHAAADRFSLKHYDIKLLNIFLQKLSGIEAEFTTLRYGLGSHVFALEMPTASAIIAKVADYGTANVQSESNGQPATIGQFTTLENTPPEFMIVGDPAAQGHSHDAFGLGLCMLHLFTGHAPYEEILADVICPCGLKSKLQCIWEDEKSHGYSVIRSVILADVYKDDDGVVVEGEPDGILYDTLYRFLVLFGIPNKKYKLKTHGRVWKAITSSLQGANKEKSYGRNNAGSKKGLDAVQFENDQKQYSLRYGQNKFIARARKRLEELEGGLDLLFSLVDFDPEKRATVCDVLNSQFMVPLREDPSKKRVNDESNHVMSFMAYATK